MLAVTHSTLIPYPFDVVLSQYFDFEHVQFVHPETLGEYHLVETRGNVIVYEQLWPRRFLIRRRSLVRQEFLPPNQVRFEFLRGLYRGVRGEAEHHPPGRSHLGGRPGGEGVSRRLAGSAAAVTPVLTRSSPCTAPSPAPDRGR